jgi:hypothetical protein
MNITYLDFMFQRGVKSEVGRWRRRGGAGRRSYTARLGAMDIAQFVFCLVHMTARCDAFSTLISARSIGGDVWEF